MALPGAVIQSLNIIIPAIKYIQCGHITHLRGGFSAAARRNHPFYDPATGSKPAS